jgi:isoquinoline 1-oxidoreductase subunit alpha
VSLKLNINGAFHEVATDPALPLLWVLRDLLGMTGTKFGCGVAACGACTVHIDGRAMRSCVLPVAGLENKTITTIEGLGGAHAAQVAWEKVQVPQCGYCQSGMIMAVAALLAENPAPSDSDIDRAITNICRCGTYPRIRLAIHAAVAAPRSAP